MQVIGCFVSNRVLCFRMVHKSEVSPFILYCFSFGCKTLAATLRNEPAVLQKYECLSLHI